VGRMFESVCLFVCLSVCLSGLKKDPKVFKVGRPRSRNIGAVFGPVVWGWDMASAGARAYINGGLGTEPSPQWGPEAKSLVKGIRGRSPT